MGWGGLLALIIFQHSLLGSLPIIKRLGSGINVLRWNAGLVVRLVAVGGFAFLFGLYDGSHLETCLLMG